MVLIDVVEVVGCRSDETTNAGKSSIISKQIPTTSQVHHENLRPKVVKRGSASFQSSLEKDVSRHKCKFQCFGALRMAYRGHKRNKR